MYSLSFSIHLQNVVVVVLNNGAVARETWDQVPLVLLLSVQTLIWAILPTMSTQESYKSEKTASDLVGHCLCGMSR